MDAVIQSSLLFDINQFTMAENQAKREFKLKKFADVRTTTYFTFFVILREIKDLLRVESYLQVQNLLWRIYRPEDSAKETSYETEVPASKNWWIEKSYLKTHKRFGTVLASPQKRKDGIARRAYNNMRDVRKGDVVIHLVDNKKFVGSSIVEKEYVSVPYIDHRGKRPGYLVELSDYEEFDYPILKEEILNEKYEKKLLELLDKYYLFYNRIMNLNEGAYLTEAPLELVSIFNEIYKEKSGKNLPRFSEGEVIESSTKEPLTTDILILPSEEDIKTAISKIQETLLIDETSIREIVTHLVAGKNVIICGPIGTGKTHLAMLIPRLVWEKVGSYYPQLYTATGDWTTLDVIGGIIPKLDKDRKIVYRIQKGCAYETISKNIQGVGENQIRCPYISPEGEYHGVWLIIDEFNRANIDKAFGEMFTAIEYSKLKVPTMKEESAFDEITIPEDFRIIGTLNTFDKHYLFKLSDALKRRFAFVEILPPPHDLAEKEKFYALKKTLEKLGSIIDNDKFNEIKNSLNYEEQVIEPEDNQSHIFDTLNVAYEILSFVRMSKNLGTAILISMYSYILVDKQSEDTDFDKSLDVALRSIIISHLENVPRWSLESIRAFCCGDIISFFRSREQTDPNFLKYALEFRKLAQYLGKDELSRRTKAYKNGQILEEHWPSYDPWRDKTSPRLPLFEQALDSLIKELELL